MFGIARVGPARAGMFIHLVPLYGAILSVALLGESLHIHHAVGMAAIMAGLACSNRAAKPRRVGAFMEAERADAVADAIADFRSRYRRP
jgi:drug/metabolite transporter (DMT)-like permease